MSESEQLILPNTQRVVSRDEMNLAEFPLTVLSTRVDPKIKTLEFSDRVTGRGGDIVSRQWIVTGADKFGLPTASDDEVLIGLIKLTVNEGFTARKVFFTRYELLKILRWSTEGRSYARLQYALDRLSGVRIKATNAFYDNETKLHSTRNFGILDAYEINDGRDTDPKPSFFEWSEVIFKSFQSGFIKKLDLDFYLGLQSAVAKRLFRFLDKHFWYRAELKFKLFSLAHEKIGISRNYRYASSLRQQIEPALNELREKGFLAAFDFQGKGTDTEIIFRAASGTPRALTGKDKRNTKSGARDEAALKSKSNAGGLNAEAIIDALTMRGIREAQAVKLIANRSELDLERIARIIEHFDSLVAAGSKLVSISPTGFLYRAVERPDDFSLPGERPKAKTNLNLFPPQSGAGSTQRIGNTGIGNTAGQQRMKASLDKAIPADLESEYLIERKQVAKKYRSDIEPDLLKKLERDVTAALASIRKSLSAERFQQAIEHCVDEKLLKLFAFPEFDEWCGRYRKV